MLVWSILRCLCMRRMKGLLLLIMRAHTERAVGCQLQEGICNLSYTSPGSCNLGAHVIVSLLVLIPCLHGRLVSNSFQKIPVSLPSTAMNNVVVIGGHGKYEIDPNPVPPSDLRLHFLLPNSLHRVPSTSLWSSAYPNKPPP